MKIAVVAPAYTTLPSEYKYLRESAAKHQIDLHILGEGKGWPEIEVYRDAMDLIATLPADYIVCTDAYDVMVARWSGPELVYHIEKSGGFLISAEAQCYPPGPWSEAYTPVGPWPYINGGQFCGRKDQLLRMMRMVLNGYTDEKGGGSQERWHKMYADGVPIAVDRGCRIFQSMSGDAVQFIKPITPTGHFLAYNSHSDSCPMFLHFNGRTAGINHWYECIYGEVV